MWASNTGQCALCDQLPSLNMILAGTCCHTCCMPTVVCCCTQYCTRQQHSSTAHSASHTALKAYLSSTAAQHLAAYRTLSSTQHSSTAALAALPACLPQPATELHQLTSCYCCGCCAAAACWRQSCGWPCCAQMQARHAPRALPQWPPCAGAACCCPALAAAQTVAPCLRPSPPRRLPPAGQT
jgi:hypothetical protein